MEGQAELCPCLNNKEMESNIVIFGKEIIDEAAIEQLRTCTGEGDYGVLTADAHVGYAHPIGGAIAYRDHISISGVGFDIACGNKAIRTDIKHEQLGSVASLMDEIQRVISFGIGRVNNEKVDHPVIEKISKININTTRSEKSRLYQKAQDQLGTVGSGNHFVDIFRDDNGYIWIGVHFGSRGFGHGITTGFLSVARGGKFEERVPDGGMFSEPVLLDAGSEAGQDYIQCLKVAGEYAYAGRDWVVDRVLKILGDPKVTFEVHNHHNFAWEEEHFGESYWVVRKGCTPAFPGQRGFIGANMFDTSVVVEGVESEESASGLYSTVHGAGRVMSRRKATGKYRYKRDDDGVKRKVQIKPGVVDFKETLARAKELGVELRGGGADESPQCYKKLKHVLAYQGKTVKVLHELHPIGVAMAGDDIYDPYKD